MHDLRPRLAPFQGSPLAAPHHTNRPDARGVRTPIQAAIDSAATIRQPSRNRSCMMLRTPDTHHYCFPFNTRANEILTGSAIHSVLLQSPWLAPNSKRLSLRSADGLDRSVRGNELIALGKARSLISSKYEYSVSLHIRSLLRKWMNHLQPPFLQQPDPNFLDPPLTGR
jgi:hypothetical protein